MSPIEPANVARGQYVGYRANRASRPDSETETFVALKCYIDNWRWAGVPSICAPASGWPRARASSRSRSRAAAIDVPGRLRVGDHGPDHLTFDLSDQPRMSLSFMASAPAPAIGWTSSPCSSR